MNSKVKRSILGAGLVLALASFVPIAAQDQPRPEVGPATASHHDTHAEVAPHGPHADRPMMMGTLRPLSATPVRVPVQAFDGRMTLDGFTLTNGQIVKQGDSLGAIRFADEEERLVAARAALTEASFELEKAEAELALARDEAEYKVERAERDFEMAARAAEDFRLWGREDRLLRAEQSLTDRLHAVENQQDELDQLEKLYGKNELATESQDIVLKRARRSLERAKQALEMEKNTNKVLVERTIPHEEWRLPSEAASKQRALVKERFNRKDAIEKAEKEVEKRRKDVEAAQRKIEKMEGDRERLDLTAAASGMVVIGELAGHNGLDEPFRNGSGVKAGQTIATIIGMEHFEFDARIPVTLLGRFREHPEVTVILDELRHDGPAVTSKGRIEKLGVLVEGGTVMARVRIEAVDGILPGLRARIDR